MQKFTQHKKLMHPTWSYTLSGDQNYWWRVSSAVMLPAPELCLVKVVGKGALGSVGSRSDRFKNLHNITNHCTRPYAKLFISSKVSDRG